MYSSITLFLAASSLYVAHITAAPAGWSPNARDFPSQISTPTTPDIDPATVTAAPAEKRRILGSLESAGNINMLEDFVLPQSISSSSSASSSSSSMSRIPRPTPGPRVRGPIQKRQALGNINMLEDFVLPQSIRPSPSSSMPSSTFASVTTGPTPTAAARVTLVGRNAQKAASNEDDAFGPLADLVFPQKISSSSSSASPSSTPAFELSPGRHPLAPPIVDSP
ncbi:MAG: hypothetical protein LQ339_000901 [Xanthoria mediterranea]|nr:MAG: hypothetical protein LQ339_000901 [Xanthoria mediterranea]